MAKKKSISIASRKAKGRELQNWTAKKIAELIGCEWGPDELVSPRPMGQSGVDVALIGEAFESFPWSIECKRTEKLDLYGSIKQAKENQKPGTDWLLIARRSRNDPIVVLDADVFFDLLRLIKGKKGR